MASLEQRSGRFRIVFRFGGQKFYHALSTDDFDDAEACRVRLEENLGLLERGQLELPAGTDLPVFLLSDGKLNGKPAAPKPLTLKEFFERYKGKLSDGAKEANTRYIENIHFAHLVRILVARTAVCAISTETLQQYVDTRSREHGRKKRPISHETIKKEIGTFASVRNKWGRPSGLVPGLAPTQGLIYRKAKAKPPYQTWQQVERQIARGGLTPVQEEELWDALFLGLPEVSAVLDHVQQQSRFPFVHPTFTFAAHTGARRSEMLRSQIDDFDFAGRIARTREKKKDRERELTFRHVPLSPMLVKVMAAWFADHPGGQLTICEVPNVPLSPQMAAHHFIWALEESKWRRLRGWHVFRHSFASNCASKGVDQRLIDEWMGHQTEQMRRRYRHLFPDQQLLALDMVFGSGSKPSF